MRAPTTHRQPSPTRDLLDALRTCQAEIRALEAQVLIGATDYADLHPALDAGPGSRPVVGHDEAEAVFVCTSLPEMDLDAPAEFGLALGMSHDTANRFMADALQLRHRLPWVWQEVLDGRLEAWRARRIAQATAGHPDDVVAHIDAQLASIARTVGLVTLARLLDEAMLHLHPEDREAAQQERLDARHATLRDDVSHRGVAHMEIAADLKDLLDFDDALPAVARALAQRGCEESLDVRRSMAVGVLADPDAAADLLRGHRPPQQPHWHDGEPHPANHADPADPDGEPRPARPPRKQLVLHAHVSEEALRGHAVVGRLETPGRGSGEPILATVLRDWCGRADTHVTVKPVIDLANHERTDAYEVPDRLREQIVLRDGHCAFPWCTRSARGCDLDHIVPYGDGGATCSCNLAPLCRRHHRIKTHRRWRYTTLEPGTWIWSSPHGFSYLVDPDGTRDITPPGHPPGDGCHLSGADAAEARVGAVAPCARP